MNEPRLSSRLLLGALAGLTATTAMTAVMRRLHKRLPEHERYPLPPREITERIAPAAMSEPALRDGSLAGHYAYGAATGALIAATSVRHRDAFGALLGAGVWAVSYFGWAPGFAILRPANSHPARRNALMIGAHLVWGGFTTWTIRELASSRDTILAHGVLADATDSSLGDGK